MLVPNLSIDLSVTGCRPSISQSCFGTLSCSSLEIVYQVAISTLLAEWQKYMLSQFCSLKLYHRDPRSLCFTPFLFSSCPFHLKGFSCLPLHTVLVLPMFFPSQRLFLLTDSEPCIVTISTVTKSPLKLAVIALPHLEILRWRAIKLKQGRKQKH